MYEYKQNKLKFKKNEKTMMTKAFGLMMTALVIFSACKPEEEKPVNKPTTGNAKLSGEITKNRTLSADTCYLIEGFVYVVDGAKLTIPAGTILKGDKSTKGTLIVERGGQIIAQGTANKPIVFTSNQPKGQRNYGDWGGIVICGKAPVNTASGEAKIEGGPRSMFGGNNPADNSGVLSYVRVEFSGIEYGTDNEINGVTFGGVGNATKVDHIQVSFCGDDSFE